MPQDSHVLETLPDSPVSPSKLDRAVYTIQGLYPASEAEGRFWFLKAKVVLSKFVKKTKRIKEVIR